MPDLAAIAEKYERYRAVRFAVEATRGFIDDDVPHMAAAMSYYLLLALAPMVLLANVVFGVLGVLTGRELAAANTAGAQAQDAAAAYYQQATAWAGSLAPWAIGALVIFGVLSVFGQFVQSVDRIWKLPPRDNAVRAYLRRRGVALALLGTAAAGLVVALIVAALVGIVVAVGLSYAQSIGIELPGIARSMWARAALVYTASALLFAVAFTVAPDRRVHWYDSLAAALVTAGAFTAGAYVLAAYLATTQRFVIFGAAQFFVGLTVWIYFSAMVALWGVELSRVMVIDAEGQRSASGAGARTS